MIVLGMDNVYLHKSCKNMLNIANYIKDNLK